MPPFIRQCWGLQVGPMHEEHRWHFVHKLWLCGVIKQQHPNWQLNPRWLGLNMIKIKKSVKVSICIAPPPHKASLRLYGIARIVKGYHSFTCTLCISSTSRMSHTCLCLPSRSWFSFTDPGGMEGWVDRPWCEVAQAEIWTCNLPIANPALCHAATSAPLMNKIQKSAGCPSYCYI